MLPVHMDASYLDVETSPLFPFGFGLSYSTFAFDDIHISPRRAPVGSAVSVSVRVTNTGTRTACTVVQLYVRDKLASLTRPVRELKGFSRVTLGPGESNVVNFTLASDSLSFFGRNGMRATEPGEFLVIVGEDSRASLVDSFELHEP